MKYFALASITALLVITFVGCKTMNHQTTASVIQPDSVRYLGASDSLSEERDPRAAEIKRQKEESDRILFEGAVGAVNEGLNHYAQEQGESTGLEYIGKGVYNFFARPFRKRDEHCTRNWLGFKVSDIVEGVPAPKECMLQIRQLGEAAKEVDGQRAENYIAALTAIIKSDPDANCRAVAVQSVGKYKSESSAYALNLALTDKERFVRIAACHAWKNHPNPKMGADALNRLLLCENDKDVSLAAVQALQVCGDPSSNEALNRMLETADPALQIAAMNSLGSIHHSACRDVNQWRQFCKGEIQTPGEPQKKESIAGALQFWK